MLNLLWIVFQWLLLIALILFFISPLVTNRGRAWKLRGSAVTIILGVTVISIVVVEIRIHPILSGLAFVIAAFAAYGVLEFRKRLKRRKPEPWVEYLNFRSTGKRPVDLDDHADAFETNRNESEEGSG